MKDINVVMYMNSDGVAPVYSYSEIEMGAAGYQWEFTNKNNDVASVEIIHNPLDDNTVGSGVPVEIIISPLAVGKTIIQAVHKRAWEDVEINRLNFNVEVINNIDA